MFKTLVVVDNLASLPAMDTETLDFDQYLAEYPKAGEPKTRLINLCATQRYLSEGYYCSLLAEARQHKVLPSVNTINDLRTLSEQQAESNTGMAVPQPLFNELKGSGDVNFLVVFGGCQQARYKRLAKYVFEQYPAPVLSVAVKHVQGLPVVQLGLLGIHEMAAEDWPFLVERLQHFTATTWRPRTSKKRARWDMAILVNPDEATPPSDQKAIKNFVKAAEQVGIQADVITPDQGRLISQYDALFIRETTAINHHTYRLARKAEQDGLVVIDDATSILRCCNKVFLQDAFTYHKIPAPRSRFVSHLDDDVCDALEQQFEYPMVLKLPESSFSMGVYKAENRQELTQRLAAMLAQSALVLVQEYVYTEYDWRIGVLNGRAIYACRYFMARNHWQIYNHGAKSHTSGDFETMPTFEVPKPVLDAAVKASAIVGKSLYGVDIKYRNNQVYVIEVNDNPSIESKIEDQYLGKELYMILMQTFADRLEARGR
ncbi:RimK family protein [Aestuariibacter halophilus]|uniref:RimK family protein n=1 Tax=Fluctibacter halophilus TaxID=226011 RepID=A0ABS8G769_9ALTE|nr:RimK family protein [Aestuariibacter halophilus]MCC2616439.1 RimK family protein [Aestuariibacter halophilus]